MLFVPRRTASAALRPLLPLFDRVAVGVPRSGCARSGIGYRHRAPGVMMGIDISPRRGLLSIDEAAQYLGISPGTMRNWLSMRRIEHVKVGRLTRVSQSALDRYISANTVLAEGDA